MQTQTKSLTITNTPKSSRAAVNPEIGPWPQPQGLKLDPMVASLAELSARRHALAYGRGIPYSPLND
jgi:hypothetical protein